MPADSPPVQIAMTDDPDCESIPVFADQGGSPQAVGEDVECSFRRDSLDGNALTTIYCVFRARMEISNDLCLIR
jgi:hypothetical protein